MYINTSFVFVVSRQRHLVVVKMTNSFQLYTVRVFCGGLCDSSLKVIVN